MTMIMMVTITTAMATAKSCIATTELPFRLMQMV
jgi:hypothetical protein